MNTNNDHMDIDSGARNRFAYIFHLWSCAGQWRASLENLETGKRFGFENLEQLFAYLMDLIEGTLGKPRRPEKGRAGKQDISTTNCEYESANSTKSVSARKGDLP